MIFLYQKSEVFSIIVIEGFDCWHSYGNSSGHGATVQGLEDHVFVNKELEDLNLMVFNLIAPRSEALSSCPRNFTHKSQKNLK